VEALFGEDTEHTLAPKHPSIEEAFGVVAFTGTDAAFTGTILKSQTINQYCKLFLIIFDSSLGSYGILSYFQPL
jgi:predicted Kef-type K+ transport protein